ncbi:MAG: polysaccharide deacetylase family protein [Clostridia bacterium]|nr:polysaccharide deacetylase family protein [Clostridia bacterium]
MRKKFLVCSLLVFVFVFVFALCVSAERIENYDETYTLVNSTTITQYLRHYYTDTNYHKRAYTDTVSVTFVDADGNMLSEVPLWEYDADDGRYYSLVWYISDWEYVTEAAEVIISDVTYTRDKYVAATYTLAKARAVDLRYTHNYTESWNFSTNAVGYDYSYSVQKPIHGIFLDINNTPNDTTDDYRLQESQGIGRDTSDSNYIGWEAQFAATGNKIVVANLRDCDFDADATGNYGTKQTWTLATHLQCIYYPDTFKYSVCQLTTVYKVDLGDGLEIINCQILRDNKNIREITLPNSLIYLGNEAFRGSDLTSLTVGEKLIYHGGSPFLYTGGADYLYLSKKSLSTLISTYTGLIANEKNKSVIYFDGNYEEALELTDKIISQNANLNGRINLVDYNTQTDRGNLSYIVLFYNYNTCDAFYRSQHSYETNKVAYPNGFENEGVLTTACSRCSKSETDTAPALIYAIGYSFDPSSTSRTTIANSYIVNKSAVDLYNSLNNVTLEIGVMFTGADKVAASMPTSLDGIHYFSNKGNNNYSTYDFIISFPGKDDPTYSQYANAEFVASAFIFDGTSYYFYQGISEDNIVSSLDSGFATTTLCSVTGDEVVSECPDSEHTVDVWNIVTPATCITVGEKNGVCTVCKKTVTATVEKTDHVLVTIEGVEPNCTRTGLTDKVECSVCGAHISGGEVIPTNGTHVCDNLTVSCLPTKYTAGKSSGVCEACGTSFTTETPNTATKEDLASVKVGVNYTGGKYTNEVFTNVAPLGRVYVTSYFMGTYGKNITDKDYATFWNADTYVDGADYTADYVEIELPKAYDIGVISLTLPNYTSYDLGEGCYVSYNIEYWNEETQGWVYIGTVSDRNATPLGANCLAQLTLDAPITMQKIRASVTHASRYAPAVIYELELFGKADEFEYDIQSIAPNANVSISGKYNDWSAGAEALTDGNLDTSWFTDIRYGGPTWALLEYNEDTYVACIQIAIKTNNSRVFKLEVYENGEWVQIGGNHTASGTLGGNVISVENEISILNFDIERNISKVKFTIVSDNEYWTSYVHEISIYSVVGAVNDDVSTECKHTNLTQSRVVASTCDSVGYTVMTCECGAELRTNATDITTHSFGEYTIATPATDTTVGTKTASCANCNATSTITYEQSYESPVVTPYLHDAPAAWAQTFDDGNYSSTYDWVIPQLEKYGYRATALIAISFASTHADAWNERLESGVFDIGSHSYNHAGLYNTTVSANDLLADVVEAQYWLRSSFIGQKIVTFAAPNGATSDDVANYLAGIFVANRNGGQGYAFYNVISDLENGRSTWGNLNSYISKADQTEGDYVFTNADGSIVYTLDANGDYVLNDSYANTGINYVFDEEEKTFVNKGYSFGTYYYVAEDYRYDFYPTGSYNLVDGKFVFVNDNSGAYRLVKATIGSYENAIDVLVNKGGFTVECIHSLLESREAISGTIHSSYVSTVSKFEYLAKLGVWAPSYQDLTLYLKEAQNAKIETISRTDDSLTINVTDNLDNYIFNQALTVKVDIDDSWMSVAVTQNGVEIPLVDSDDYRASKNMSTISCTIENGYLYIDIIPDGGEIVITATSKIVETENGGAQIGADITDILG